jgi:hypothetical protein
MGKSVKSTPAPTPEPASKQVSAEASQNRVTTFRPDGSTALEYGYIGSDGNFVAGAPAQSDLPQAAVKTTETDFERQIREKQEAAALGTADVIGQNVDSLSPAPTYDPTASGMAQQIYDRSADLLREDIERSSTRLDNNLQARGLAPGSTAFNRAKQSADRTENEAWSNLAQDAVLAAQGESRADYATQESERANRYGELAALFGGQYAQAGAQPIAQGAPSLNVGGAYQNAYNQQMTAYNAALAQQQQQNAGWGSLASAAGAGLGMLLCSRDLKSIDGHLSPEWAWGVVERARMLRWKYRPEAELGEDDHAGPIAEDFRELTGFGDGKTIHPSDPIAVLWATAQMMQRRIIALEEELHGRAG